MRSSLALLSGVLLLAGEAAWAQPGGSPYPWPPLATDMRTDPAVRSGVLPNGMRFAILRNATPPGTVSLRLRIEAGSLHEREDERGVAHFLEHMVLNGTRNVPEGEFAKRLERAGLRLGTDINASTSLGETVFRIDLPKAGDEPLRDALALLRDVVDEATLAPAAIDRERGIISAEARGRATPSSRAAQDVADFAFGNWLSTQRMPIGLPQVIASATQAKLTRFYNAYYRPDRAVLVAVGDFDPQVMEAAIRTGFADWQGEGPAGSEPNLGSLVRRDLAARIFVEPGIPASVTVAWLRPFDARPDTRDRRRDTLLELMGIAILNRRFEQLATGAAPPFVSASAGSSNGKTRGSYTRITAVVASGQWRDALAAISQEQRRLVAHGVLPGELEREIAGFRKSGTFAASAASTRNSRGLAVAILNAIDNERAFTTPTDQLALFEDFVRGLTPASVNAALRPLFAGQGPVLHLTSPTPISEGESGVLAAYRASAAKEAAAPVAPVVKRFTYASFGKPGVVVERREIAEGVDATAVRFANGTRLTVKRTAFSKDQILVSVRFGNGRLALPPGKPLPGPLSAAVIGGGLGDLTHNELQQAMAPVISGVNFGVGNERFVLGGATRPADFPTQMRLLAAYLTDPAWRPTAWNRARSMSKTMHDVISATPGGVMGRDLGVLLASGDGRWRTPTTEEIARGRVEDARALLEDAFADGPVEVVIVGDVTVEEAIAQTAATFGALTGRGSAPSAAPGARKLAFPAPVPTPVVLTHKGRADQALGFIAWPTADIHSDPKRARALRLLAQVMQLRLTDELREKQGAAYSPSISATHSTTFPGYGYMSGSFEAPPDKLAGFFADAQKIADALAAAPPTDDELERARRPAIASISRERASSNVWWMSAIEDIQTDPRVLDNLTTHIPEIEAVSPADLQRLAREYLRSPKSWKLIVVPAGSADVAVSSKQP